MDRRERGAHPGSAFNGPVLRWLVESAVERGSTAHCAKWRKPGAASASPWAQFIASRGAVIPRRDFHHLAEWTVESTPSRQNRPSTTILLSCVVELGVESSWNRRSHGPAADCARCCKPAAASADSSPRQAGRARTLRSRLLAASLLMSHASSRLTMSLRSMVSLPVVPWGARAWGAPQDSDGWPARSPRAPRAALEDRYSSV